MTITPQPPLNHAAIHDPAGRDPVHWALMPSYPGKHGATFMSIAVEACASALARTSGTPDLARIDTPYAFTCTKIDTCIGNAPTNIIGGQNCLALYDSTGQSLYRSSTYSMTTIGGVGGAYIVGDALTDTGASGFTATVKTLSGNGVGTLTTTAAGTGITNGQVLTLSNAHGGTGAQITFTVDNASYQLIDTSLTAAGIVSVAPGSVAVSTSFVWAALLVNSTGTVPGLFNSGIAQANLANYGLTTGTARSANWGSSKTVLGTSFTPSSALAQGGRIFWFAIS